MGDSRSGRYGASVVRLVLAALAVLLVAPAAASALDTEKILDGGFEEAGQSLNSPRWTGDENPQNTPICHRHAPDCPITPQSRPRTGDNWVWFGGGGSNAPNHTASVSQVVTIPATGPATLRFFLWAGYHSLVGPDATIAIKIDNDVVRTISEADPAYFADFAQATVDLSFYADGGSHTVKFEFTNPLGEDPNLHLDDVSLLVGDDDNDGIAQPHNGGNDNCPSIANPDQTNTDVTQSPPGDAFGDACDADDDNDSVNDAVDNCDFTQNAGQANNDLDAFGDACDADDDNDTIEDLEDNCDFDANTDQADTDGQGDGNACDTDDDNDSRLDAGIPPDGCPQGAIGWTSNGSTDFDTDGCRDIGEDFDDDNDTKLDVADACSKSTPKTNPIFVSNATTDHDGDGCRDSENEDLDDDNDGKADGPTDSCPRGTTGWTSSPATDNDNDGCQDAHVEDDDDDNDGDLDAATTAS